jgi:hypothetical protein
VATGNSSMSPLVQATHTVPIVFNNVADPVGSGYVDSLARPGGNVTGFLQFEYSLSGKWLELLKQIAPGVMRAAVLRDPTIPAGVGQFAIIQSVAPSVGVDVSAISMLDASEIERAVTAFARSPNGGLILTASALAIVHRNLIIALAAQHKLPAVYYRRYFATSGGLISYGYDVVQQLPRRGWLRRSHSQGREAGRHAGAGADRIRTGDQSQDRKDARSDHSAVAARHGRRGHRVGAMSAIGTKQTYRVALHMCAFGGKAVIAVGGVLRLLTATGARM